MRQPRNYLVYNYLLYPYTEHSTNFAWKICRLLIEEGLPLARLALRVSSSLSVDIAISVVA
jgi:hypothetical protein